MPKPFTIGIEVEEIALGVVMRKLNAMPGVISLHMDFDKPRANGNGHNMPRQPGRKFTKDERALLRFMDDPDYTRKLRGAPDDDKPARKPRGTFKITGQQFLLKLLARRPRTMQELREAFEAEGRSAKSIASLMHNLKQSGAIQNTGRGTWTLKAKAAKKKAVKAKPKPKAAAVKKKPAAAKPAAAAVAAAE